MPAAPQPFAVAQQPGGYPAAEAAPAGGSSGCATAGVSTLRLPGRPPAAPFGLGHGGGFQGRGLGTPRRSLGGHLTPRTPRTPERTPRSKLKGRPNVIRIAGAASLFHRLAKEDGPLVAQGLLLAAGQGDPAATDKIGMRLNPREAEAAMRRIEADFMLMAMDEDPDLDDGEDAGMAGAGSGPGPAGAGATASATASMALARRPRALKVLPFDVANSLRLMAWQVSWREAMQRAASSAKPMPNLAAEEKASTELPSGVFWEPGVREAMAKEATEKWLAAAAKMATDGFPALAPEEAAAAVEAAEAVARHAAAFRVEPCSREGQAKEAWASYTEARRRVAASGRLDESLNEALNGVLRNAAWYAANSVAAFQKFMSGDDEEQEEDEEAEPEEEDDEAEPEDETAMFGDEYPGSQDDAMSDLLHFVRHSAECHRGSFGSGVAPRWRGLQLKLGAEASDVEAAGAAGFNVVRLPVVEPMADAGRDPLDDLRPALKACSAAKVEVVLDLSSWGSSAPSGASVQQLVGRVWHLASRSVSLGMLSGVVLPRVPLQDAAPLVTALRKGGLRPGDCAAVLQLREAPCDDEGNYSGELRQALLQGEEGVLFKDGHLVLEVQPQSLSEPREKMPTAQDLLDEASHSHEGINDSLPLGCVGFRVELPVGEAYATARREALCGATGSDQWLEELAARFSAAAGSGATHGWFAELGDAAARNACFGGRWNWPQESASRILWPHTAPHVATLVYLDGFDSEPDAFLRHPEYFYREEGPSATEEERQRFGPYPGLKIVLPTPPTRPHPAYNGWKSPSWYSYATDHEGEAEDELDEASLWDTAFRIHALLDEETAKLGPGGGRVFLGGGSQGCCTALHVALNYQGKLGPLAGVAACQGHLLSCTSVPSTWGISGIPIRIYHGLADTTMPWESWVSATYNRLRQTGCDLDFAVEEGVEHSDEEAEARWVRAFLRELWPRVSLRAEAAAFGA